MTTSSAEPRGAATTRSLLDDMAQGDPAERLRLVDLLADNHISNLFVVEDGRPVAVQLAVEAHGRYSLFKIGFDEQFARCSPGNLLMLHTVRWAAERELASFEFLGAEEPWTSVWTDVSRSCREVHVYPATWRSVPAAAAVGGELARRSGREGLARLRARRSS